MNSTAAIGATVIAIVTAILGVVVAAGLDLSKDLQDHVLTLITVAVPAVIAGIAWLHHNHAKVLAAREANNTSSAARVNL